MSEDWKKLKVDPRLAVTPDPGFRLAVKIYNYSVTIGF